MAKYHAGRSGWVAQNLPLFQEWVYNECYVKGLFPEQEGK